MLLDEQIPKKVKSRYNGAYFQSLNYSHKKDISEGIVIEPSISFDPKESSVGLSQIASWNGSPIRVLYYVSKFIRQLKQAASIVNMRLITLRILNLINDMASDSAILGQQNNQQLCQSLFRDIVIEPDSKYKMIWDLTLFLSVLASLFYLPIYISFNIDKDDFYAFFEILPQILLALDMLVCCFTSYYEKGLINREKIAQHYASTHLFYDLFVVLPGILDIIGFKYIKLFLLFRIIKLPRMLQSLEELINLRENYANIFQLIKLGFFVILVCHYCACLWAYLGIYQQDLNQYSWLVKYNIDENNWLSIYVTSLYFSVITTLTIGYGDITPQTDLEKIYVIFVALLICAVLAYSISTIGNIFKSMQEKQDQFKSQMKIIIRYMKAKNLSPQIQMQVKKFYEHFFNQESGLTNQAEQLLQNLNKDLKEKIAVEVYSGLLKQSKLFSQMSDELVKRICSTIKEASFIQGNIVFNKNDQINRLYYLLKGEISYIANDKTIQILQQGPIAEKEFISQRHNIANIISTQFSQVAYIDYDEFTTILKDYDDDFQRFHLQKDKLNFNEDYRNYGQICEICKWTHQFIKCPYVFVNINKNRVLKQLQLSQEQERNKKDRGYRRYRTFQYIKITQENVLAKILQHGLIKDGDLNDQYLLQLGFQGYNYNNSKTLQVISDMNNNIYSMSSELVQQSSYEKSKFQTSFTNKISSQYDIKPRQQQNQQQTKFTHPTSNLQNIINSRCRIVSQNSVGKLEKEDQDCSELRQAEFQRQNAKIETAETDMLTVMEKQIEQNLFHNKTSLNIDKFQIYQIYYPSHNVDSILNQIKTTQSNLQKFKYLSVFRRNFNRIS